MKKTRRNAFTIVELVIVIAVVAILAAVLIPTFTSLVKKAQTSKDTQLIRNLNTALAVDKATGKEHNTMQDALDAALEGGYDVEKINASNTDNEILWDSINDAFCYLEGKELENNNSNVKYLPEMELKTKAEDLNKYDFWKIYTDTDRNIVTNGSEQTFSIYLGGNDFAAAVAVKVGFDAGKNTNIPSVTYNGETAPKNVIIRTCSANTTLYVTVYEQGQAGTEDYKCDTVNHYDVAGKLVATNVGMGSYHENGKVFYAEVVKGKVVAEEKAEIEVLYAKNSDVAIFESEGGSIKEAYATSEINHSGNKTLEVLTEQEIKTKGEAAKEQATENELVEKELKADTVAYIKNGTTITQYTKLEDAIAAVSDNGDSVTKIVICKDYVLEGNKEDEYIAEKETHKSKVLNIVNKNIHFLGRGETKPVITGAIEIRNSGSNSIIFENIKFNNNQKYYSNISDFSTCTSENDVNTLRINSCEFVTDLKHYSQTSVVAICHKNYKVGTQLIFEKNKVDISKGYYHNIISTRASRYVNAKGEIEIQSIAASKSATIKGYKQHIIEGNNIDGHSTNVSYGYIGNFAIITNNIIANLDSRAFQLIGTYSTENEEGQFDVEISSNTFKNLKEIFKMYYIDEIVEKDYFNFQLASSVGSNANIFESVGRIGVASTETAKFIQIFGADLASNTFNGIEKASVTLTFAKVELELVSELYTDIMTLEDGTQIITYTQAVKPAGLETRTGYKITLDNKNLWYFASKTIGEHYFIGDDNKVYIVHLGAGSATNKENLRFTDKAEPSDWPARLIAERGKEQEQANKESVDVGKIITAGDFYETNFTINQWLGNTTYNSNSINEDVEGNKVNITSDNPSKLNLFISNIGSHQKLIVTSDNTKQGNSNDYVVIVDGLIGQLVVNGTFEVEVDTNIANINVLGAQTITINEGKKVSGILKVTESNNTVVNKGNIGSLYLFAKSTVTNEGTINLLTNGDINPGGITRLLSVAAKAKGSVITNSGTINTISTKASIELTNNVNATINALTLGFVNAEGYEYAKGSTVINNGKMCQTSGSNINIFAQTTFTNNGAIGVEGRGPSGNHAEEGCDRIGGIINIGYYGYSDTHNNTVFNNTGTIYEGSRHNGTSHQQITFWVWGVFKGYGQKPIITITNTGNINGTNWQSGTTLPAFTINGDLSFTKN